MKISIEKLTFECIIGILDFERTNEQKVVIDISFEYDFLNEENFIDYSKISSEVEEFMKKEKFELLENAVINVDKYLNKNYPIKNLKIKISKPDILKNCIVSIEH
ncbi:dihydroneopterin aldolase [Arcobacter sp. CECT 8983]|uniref:dihydroneopterin aldolase n=1 Tax=Arcobacter sp. CECT 8983 TaxID=2044508 RepID=UPI00100A6C15|nr:dihydroneopterin aldolase [Arcobacter sp. CECT 8983]RXJ88568.1 dihydroneopterin aldolase [Arcobacter sp. CECT 8983]